MSKKDVIPWWYYPALVAFIIIVVALSIAVYLGDKWVLAQFLNK